VRAQAENARIAIVVPCYQSARYLAETVESVRAQTLEHWRLVVVDDGSTDDPCGAISEALDSDARLAFVRQENAGVAAARNAGARAVGRSDYILFLDADDVLEPQMLATMVDWLDGHPQAAVAYCKPSFIDERGGPATSTWAPRLRPTRRGVGVIPDEDPVTPFVSVFCLAGIVPSLAVIRRSHFDATGGWDESFGQHYEDTLLFLQLSLQAEIHHVPTALVRHRRHGGQSTGDASKFARQEKKLYDRFRERPPLTRRDADVVREAWRFRERRLVPRRALSAAAANMRNGRPFVAARFLAGAARIALGSFLLGPGRVRS
jgi:glycosyltransferase involved in cell wall biosynthesis